MKRHQGIYLYECPYCKKGISSTHGMKTHLKTNHTGQWGFSCLKCGAEFTNVRQLKVHLDQNNCKGWDWYVIMIEHDGW